MTTDFAWECHHTHQSSTIVAREVFFTDLHKAPKGLLWRETKQEILSTGHWSDFPPRILACFPTKCKKPVQFNSAFLGPPHFLETLGRSIKGTILRKEKAQDAEHMVSPKNSCGPHSLGLSIHWPKHCPLHNDTWKHSCCWFASYWEQQRRVPGLCGRCSSGHEPIVWARPSLSPMRLQEFHIYSNSHWVLSNADIPMVRT